MPDQTSVISELLTKELYSRTDLYDLIFRCFPTYNENSCNWIIGMLCKKGVLFPVGKGFFQRGKLEWAAKLEGPCGKAVQKTIAEMPNLKASFINLNYVNDMCGFENGPDCSILEVDKGNLFPAYMKLRESYRKDVLLTPTEHELNFYMRPGAIILKPLFSKAPAKRDGTICIEKLIVDLIADRTYRWLYPDVDFDDSIREFASQYFVNYSHLNHYAKRRRCEELITDILEGKNKEFGCRIDKGE